MHADLKVILKIMEKRNCAIPAFNVYNIKSILGVTNAAKEIGVPVILQMYDRLSDHQDARYVALMALEAMRELDTPAVFHLDCRIGTTKALRALCYRATGTVIDASVFPPEESTETAHSMVETCGACGVSVEGELGRVGMIRDVPTNEYTDMEEAEQLVRETGMAALAIMMGTAHGRYRRAPVLDVGRIRDIKAVTGIPLVLHGGSGVSGEQVSMAMEAGIRRMNFGIDLYYSFLDRVFEVDRSIYALGLFVEESIQAVREFAISKIRPLGADTE